jgi:hypothetical protein
MEYVDWGFQIADCGLMKGARYKAHGRGQTTEDRWQIEDCGLRVSASRHLPSASLGHYTSLSLGMERGYCEFRIANF